MNDFFRLSRRVVLLGLFAISLPQPAHATMYISRVDVSVDEVGDVLFRFTADTGRVVPLNRFSVIGQVEGKYDHGDLSWHVSIRPGSYKWISEIKYGRPVPGFPESEARKLIEGERYIAYMGGAGIAASIEFELVRYEGKLAVRVIKRE